jgi:hypothetical protein
VKTRPSEFLGLPGDSYSAYCLDQAVIYFGLVLEGQLQEAGHKPGKEERRAQAARERILEKVFGKQEEGSGFADPAALLG